MVEDVVVKSGRRIAIGDTWLDIRDDNVPVQFVDLIVESRQANGIVALSFGALIADASNNDAFVDVACRIRMNLVTAQNLHRWLGDMISDALKPVDKSQAN